MTSSESTSGPETTPGDGNTPRKRCRALEQAHPEWLISYDSGIRVWSAFRHHFPDRREIAAGIELLIKAPSAERLEEKLVRQAEILKTLPAPPLPALPWTFLRH